MSEQASLYVRGVKPGVLAALDEHARALTAKGGRRWSRSDIVREILNSWAPEKVAPIVEREKAS